MKRLGLILSAAVICVVASSQAQASYSVIKWKSGFCQVWDNALPTKPSPKDYKIVSRPHKTFAGAMNRRMKLVGKKACW